VAAFCFRRDCVRDSPPEARFANPTKATALSGRAPLVPSLERTRSARLTLAIGSDVVLGRQSLLVLPSDYVGQASRRYRRLRSGDRNPGFDVADLVAHWNRCNRLGLRHTKRLQDERDLHRVLFQSVETSTFTHVTGTHVGVEE
jgi:hypothetical protein